MTKTIFKTITFSIPNDYKDIGNEFIFIGNHINSYIKKGYKFMHIYSYKNIIEGYINLVIHLSKEVEEDE